MSTSRLEAFSDGVFAIAITSSSWRSGCLSARARMAHELADQSSSYLAYVVSFLVIGIIWMNRHAVIDHLREANRPPMALNLFLVL
jgi:uncharacterized membrane protein